MDKKQFLSAAAAICAMATLVGCGSSGGTSSMKADEKQSITVWSWDEGVKNVVAGFEKEHPNITVNVRNGGSGSDEYNALDNAIQAGKGVPDLVQFEYFALPLFAMPGKLADLGELGADKIKDDYTKAAWDDVSVNDKVYALPYDYGSLTMFYNKDTFAKAGITEAPKTWNEYYEAAKKIKALGDNYYIVNDGSDHIFNLLALIWQAGGRPFKVDGESVTIDFHDEGSEKAIQFWDKMIKEGLIDTKMTNWSDEWNRGLNDGSLASQINGGWLVSSLPDRAPDQAGKFVVSQIPQWSGSENVSSELGGSSYAIPAKSEHKEAAYQFLEYMTHGAGVETRVEERNALVPNLSVLKDSQWLSKKTDYYGDQEFNKTLSEVAQSVGTGWQFPPFMQYGRSTFDDDASDYYNNKQGNLQDVVDAWAQEMIAYGNKQGFKVS